MNDRRSGKDRRVKTVLVEENGDQDTRFATKDRRQARPSPSAATIQFLRTVAGEAFSREDLRKEAQLMLAAAEAKQADAELARLGHPAFAEKKL